MRKLATIRKIDTLTPIDGADAIECATVGGWKVVAQKGLYKEGDLAVYFEIDSWIPTLLAPFLSKGKEPREFEGVKGERLKTIKLRGQLSQGLLMPVHNDKTGTYLMIYTDETGEYSLTVAEGDDVTEALGIKKWEKPMNAQLAGVCKGNFPTLIPKTDQERCQNLKKEIVAANEAGLKFEITEKLEGSSMTVYLMKGEFGVCSRNMDLKETEGNSFWATARKDDIEAKMRAVDEYWDFAIQGELIGPGIQGNIYNLKETEFRVFDVYNIQTGEYLKPAARRDLIGWMDLKHVPVIAATADMYDTLGLTDIPQLLGFAEGKSVLGDTEREGVVFKQVDGGMSFKAISNAYLMNEK
jgi:RNA ligase (TIGR02306 family)